MAGALAAKDAARIASRVKLRRTVFRLMVTSVEWLRGPGDGAPAACREGEEATGRAILPLLPSPAPTAVSNPCSQRG